MLLQGIKWQGTHYFEGHAGTQVAARRRRPFYPLANALSGWSLAMNDGQHFFYTNNGQLFVLCPPLPAPPVQPGQPVPPKL